MRQPEWKTVYHYFRLRAHQSSVRFSLVHIRNNFWLKSNQKKAINREFNLIYRLSGVRKIQNLINELVVEVEEVRRLLHRDRFVCLLVANSERVFPLLWFWLQLLGLDWF